LTSAVILVLAVFGASCVEAVEALTLVVAAGTTRGWRSAFEGAAAALVLLVVLVAAIGVPLIHYVPINVLRVVIGGLLLVLGLGWLRKSILRASGHKALHDEDLIFAKTVAGLSDDERGAAKKRDAIGFTIAFKGVLLEGTEVLLIVLSLGASSHRLGLAAGAAGAAAVVVTIVGIAVARQLREVPENTMKLGVGIMLTSFGVFWIGEGSGFRWPGSDLAILVLIGIFLTVTALSIRFMRSILPTPEPSPAPLELRQTP
jgi:Ca2+/H+ antiporter, TMEM165/GDT1 family